MRSKVENVNLRKMKWLDLIVYFANLLDKSDFSSKDLVDYFQFKYINYIKVEYWIVPRYTTQTSCAKKLLNCYGKELSISLINILFDKYKLFFGDNNIIWSLGLLSSEKTGWLFEKLMIEYRKEKSEEKEFVFKRLNSKPQSEWTSEDFEIYNSIMKEMANGKT